MLRGFLLGAASAVLVFSAANAADIYRAEGPGGFYVPVTSWTGWYLGGNVGYGWGGDGRIDPRATGFNTGLVPPPDGPAFVAAELAGLSPLNTNPKGILGGMQTGYNYQVNKFVVGIEADYSAANIAGSQKRSSNSILTSAPAFGITTNVAGQETLDSFGTVRVRLGITPFDRGLIYATGGFALGHASSNIAISQTETGPTVTPVTFSPSSGSASSSLTGWTIGGGGEWAFTPNWSIKAEYLYYDLGSLQYTANQITSITSSAFGPAPNTPFAFVNPAPSADFRGSIVRIGLNYKFGYEYDPLK